MVVSVDIGGRDRYAIEGNRVPGIGGLKYCMFRRNDKSTVADAILLTVCAFCYQGLDTCERHAVTGVVQVQHGPGLTGSPVSRLLAVTLDEHLSSLLFRVSDPGGLGLMGLVDRVLGEELFGL